MILRYSPPRRSRRALVIAAAAALALALLMPAAPVNVGTPAAGESVSAA